jgi:hypothetical protein
MFVVATTRRNASPSLILELLLRVARVIKDYCGVLTEDALRKNAILVYELLDEMLDHGYAQSTNTDSLKHRVHNEPGAFARRTRWTARTPGRLRTPGEPGDARFPAEAETTAASLLGTFQTRRPCSPA